MAWYNAGDWSAVRVDRRGLILQQMCYAINERETAVGRTLTAWPNSVAANPSSWAFDGYRVDRAGLVLTSIRDAIPSLYDTGEAERFVQSDGSNWTEALLFTAAGYGASWLAVDGEITNDVRPFLQTKAVIDELIYYNDSRTVSLTVENVENLYGEGTDNVNAQKQTAYDAAIAALADTTVTRGYLIQAFQNDWDKVPVFVGNTIKLQTYGVCRLKFPLGVKPVTYELDFEEYSLYYNSHPDAITVDVNGTSVVLNGTGIDTTYTHTYVLGDTMALGNTYLSGGYWYTDITAEWTYPASHPFSSDFDSDAGSRYFYVSDQSTTATVVVTLAPTYG